MKADTWSLDYGSYYGSLSVPALGALSRKNSSRTPSIIVQTEGFPSLNVELICKIVQESARGQGLVFSVQGLGFTGVCAEIPKP